MGAYIINIPDTVDRIIYVNVGPDSGRTYISSHRVEDLTPYTEPDLEQIRKEAYEKGRKDGIKDGKCEAWEAARKIGSNSMCSLEEMGFDFSQCVIADYNPSWFVVKNYSASECIEKIRQYEQRQEKIQVGDEVIYNDRRCVVLVPETPEKYGCVMDAEGERHGFENKDVEKTGRHFPEIAEVFAKMGGEE